MSPGSISGGGVGVGVGFSFGTGGGSPSFGALRPDCEVCGVGLGLGAGVCVRGRSWLSAAAPKRNAEMIKAHVTKSVVRRTLSFLTNPGTPSTTNSHRQTVYPIWLSDLTIDITLATHTKRSSDPVSGRERQIQRFTPTKRMRLGQPASQLVCGHERTRKEMQRGQFRVAGHLFAGVRRSTQRAPDVA